MPRDIPPLTAAYADMLLAEQARRAERDMHLSYGYAIPAHVKERVRCMDPHILRTRIDMARRTVRWTIRRLRDGEIDRKRAADFVAFNWTHYRNTQRQLRELYAALDGAAGRTA